MNDSQRKYVYLNFLNSELDSDAEKGEVLLYSLIRNKKKIKSPNNFYLSKWKSHVRWVPGRAIAQAVIRWLPTAAARVQTRVWSCGNL
jgi:hypothetical protein